ncbi:MAG: 3-isopropylmalate dehydratase small subunit, partial [Candidatus Omnitrophica bacterium]|nr:3-isopropylmalate dehydratase small subunit [Candidatus Omnitrophota bacterium]
GCGVSAVVAKSFAAIFFRNAINIGLPFLELGDTSAISDGDEIEIDLSTGNIRNISKGTGYKTQAFPDFLQEIVRKNGLMNYIKERIKNKCTK